MDFDLISARSDIEAIDKAMIELFIKRMKKSAIIARYKSENRLPITDNVREVQLLQYNLCFLSSLTDDRMIKDLYCKFFQNTLDISKEYQKEITKNGTSND